MNKLPDIWKDNKGKNFRITEMGWSHLLNTVRMLAVQQLAEYNPKRQDYIEALQSELDRRKFKKVTKDLF